MLSYTPRLLSASRRSPSARIADRAVWALIVDQTSRRLSLIIPVYNNAHLLQKSVVALQGQTRVPDEILLADDGSSEDVPAAVSGALTSFSCPVRYVRQQHRGFRLAKSRNNAIRESTGDILVFIDQDMIYTSGYLAGFARHVCDGVFVVGAPVYLTETQSDRVTEDVIRAQAFESVLTTRQRRAHRRQFVKESFYTLMRRYLFDRTYRPKVRGCAFGVTRRDLLRVDGFDERYMGWGHEDDDLGQRLNRTGVAGRNVFWRNYALHLYHPSHHVGGSENRAYYVRRRAEIRAGDTLARRGLSDPLDGAEYEVRTLRG